MRAERVLDDAAVHAMTGEHAVFGVDEKTLTTDGTADVRGEFRWLTRVHWRPAFLHLTSLFWGVVSPLRDHFDPVCRSDERTGMVQARDRGATDGGCELVRLGQRKYAGS